MKNKNTAAPYRQIRANFTSTTIRVYQAYSHQIADSALRAGRFVSPPFSMKRMTWIKPSFLWMMYRAGWGFKDDGQRRILGIDISRAGFHWALDHAALSHPPDGTTHEEWRKVLDERPVRIQWDPERDLYHNPQDHRSIQIGISGPAVNLYANEWIQGIEDVTETAHVIKARVEAGDISGAMLPEEQPYPLDDGLAQSIGINPA